MTDGFLSSSKSSTSYCDVGGESYEATYGASFSTYAYDASLQLIPQRPLFLGKPLKIKGF